MTRVHLENGQILPLIKECEMLVLIISVLCLVIPFSYVSLLTLDSDETHIWIKEWLEIDLKWKWAHAPFLNLITRVASNCFKYHIFWNYDEFALCIALISIHSFIHSFHTNSAQSWVIMLLAHHSHYYKAIVQYL